MIEQWASREALDVHSAGPALAALGSQLAGRVAGPPALMLLDALPGGADAKGQRVC